MRRLPLLAAGLAVLATSAAALQSAPALNAAERKALAAAVANPARSEAPIPSGQPAASTTSRGGTRPGGTSAAASAARAPTTTTTGPQPPSTSRRAERSTHGTPSASRRSALGAPNLRPAPAASRSAATPGNDADTA